MAMVPTWFTGSLLVIPTRMLDRDGRIDIVTNDFDLVERVTGIRHKRTEEDLCWGRKC